MDAVVVRDLVVERGRRRVLQDLSFSVPPGQVTGLLGPSGSGKSTLMRAVVGAQQVRSGEVTVGIRPGSFRLNQDAKAFRGTVERNEFHGETRLICLKNDRHEINISVPPEIRPAIGEVIGVEVASSDIHVFDPGSGLRLN